MSRQVDLDKVGACASSVCAVHCLITGVAYGLLSIVGLDFLGSVTADIVFLTIAVLVGGFAVVMGYRRHRSLLPATIFATGLGLVVLSHFVLGHRHGDGHDHSHALTTVLAVVGGLTLVGFHFLNSRLHQRTR